MAHGIRCAVARMKDVRSPEFRRLLDETEAPLITAPILLEISAVLVRLAAALQDDTAQPVGPPDAAGERLLKMPAVAERLNVPEAYVRELGRLGKLPTVRLGAKYVRVRVSDLEKWIRDRGAASRDGERPDANGVDGNGRASANRSR